MLTCTVETSATASTVLSSPSQATPGVHSRGWPKSVVLSSPKAYTAAICRSLSLYLKGLPQPTDTTGLGPVLAVTLNAQGKDAAERTWLRQGVGVSSKLLNFKTKHKSVCSRETLDYASWINMFNSSVSADFTTCSDARKPAAQYCASTASCQVL